MGKHGERARLWPSLLGLAAAALAIGAFIALLIIDPRPGVAVCTYKSGAVMVQITGPDCYPIMRQVTDDTDRGWGMTGTARGNLYAQMRKGPDTVRIYESGDRAFAGTLERFLEARQFSAQVPSPAP